MIYYIKKVFVIVSLLFVSAQAASVISVVSPANSVVLHPGWNLVSSSEDEVSIPTTYGSISDVEIVWYYDTASSTWSLYSSDENISQATATQYATIENLSPYSGYWVKSNAATTMLVSPVAPVTKVECSDTLEVPNITGAPTSYVQVNHPYSYTPQTEYGGAVSSYSISNEPDWLDFNTTTGILSGVAPTTTGEYNGIEITATNCKGSDNVVYNITVAELYPPYFDMVYDTPVNQSAQYVDYKYSTDDYWMQRVNGVILQVDDVNYTLNSSDYNLTSGNFRLNIATGDSTILRAPAQYWNMYIQAEGYSEDAFLNYIQVIPDVNSCTLQSYNYAVPTNGVLEGYTFASGPDTDSISFISRDGYGLGWFNYYNVGNEFWEMDYHASPQAGVDKYYYWQNNDCGLMDINVTEAVPSAGLSILNNSDTDSDDLHATIGVELTNTTFTDSALIYIQIVGSLSASLGWIYDDATHAHIEIGTEHMNAQDASIYVNVLHYEIESDENLTTNSVVVQAPAL